MGKGSQHDQDDNFKTLLEISPDAIILLQENKIIRVNSAALALFNLNSEKDLVGKSFLKLIGSMGNGYGEDIYSDHVDPNRESFRETRCLNVDGKEVFVNLISTHITYDGKPTTISLFKNLSVRHDLEKELNESHELYRGLMEEVGVGIGIWSEEGTLIRFNDIASARMGKPSESFEGSSFEDIFGDELGLKYRKRMEQSIQSSDPIRFEDEVDLPGGTRFFSSYFNVIRDLKGEIQEIQIISDDITEKKHWEIDMARSNLMMESILENTNEFIMIADEKARPVMFNSAYAREIKEMLGHDVERGMNPYKLIGDPGVDAFWEGCHERVLSGESFTTEFEFPLSKGDSKYYSVSFHPMQLDGKITGFTEYSRDITDLKVTQKSILDSEERFRPIFEKNPIGIILASLDFNVHQTNERFCDMIGYTRDEMIGQPVMKYLHKDSIEETMSNNLKLSSGEINEFSMNIKVLRENGQVMICSLTVSKINNEKGEPVYYIGSIRDITEENTAMDEVFKSQLILSETLNNLKDSVSVINDEMVFELVNNSFRKLLNQIGIDGDPIGMKIFEIQPFLPETVKEEYLRVFKTGEILETNEVTEIDGQVIFTHTIKIPLKIDGKVRKVITVIRDISNERRAHEKLISNEELLRRALDSTMNGILVVNNEGVATHMNQRFLEMWDMPKEVANSMDDSKMLEFAQNVFCEPSKFLNKVMELYRSKETSLDHLETVDGRSMERYSCPLIIDEKITGRVWSFRDITSEVTIKNEIIKERERAEFYLDLLGHDIGNLHQGIFTGFQLARTTSDPKIRELCLDSTDDLIRRSIKLVKNVLLLSRLNVSDPELKRFDIREVIKNSIENIQLMFPGKALEIEKNLGKGKVQILAEPILEELFLNIMHNGIKFQTDGVPKLEIELKKTKNYGTVMISDHGCGISDSQKRKLFERFSPQGMGSQTGIGLSLVKVLSERYSGSVEVVDRVKNDHTKGAKFIVSFPLV